MNKKFLADLGLEGSRAGNVDELVKAELAKRSTDTINKYLSLAPQITIPSSDDIPKTPAEQIKSSFALQRKTIKWNMGNCSILT